MMTSAKEKNGQFVLSASEEFSFTIEFFGFEVNSNLSNVSNSKVTTSTTSRYLPLVIGHR